MASSQSAPLPPDIDHRHVYMGIIIAITILSIGIAWLRMYTRLCISRNAWWDDWVMFAATFLTILTNGILINAFALGIGRHIQYVRPKQIPEVFKWLWAAEPTNLFALYAVRLSIALFFLRLIPKHEKMYRCAIWASVLGLTVSDIYVSINYFIQCRPIRKVWKPETEGTCVSDAVCAAAPWVYQGVSIVADIALVLVAIFRFRRLKLPPRMRFGVMALCCLGIFTCICAIVKTALLPALFNKKNQDKTWNLAQLCFWAQMEICVGVICGSLPCLKPLYELIKQSAGPSRPLPSSHGFSSSSNAHSGRSKFSAPVAIRLESRSNSQELPAGKDRDEGNASGRLRDGRWNPWKEPKVRLREDEISFGMEILRTTEMHQSTETVNEER